MRRYAPRGEETYAPTVLLVMHHVGAGSPRPVAPIDKPVRFAAKPSCAVTHRGGEETYAPTSVMRHVGAGLPRPVAPSTTPSGSRQNHRTPSRTAGARKPTPLQSHASRRGGVAPPGRPANTDRPVCGKTIVRRYAPSGRGNLRPYGYPCVSDARQQHCAGSSPVSCATNRPSNARLEHRLPQPAPRPVRRDRRLQRRDDRQPPLDLGDDAVLFARGEERYCKFLQSKRGGREMF